jgi:hypothetical protein
MQTTHTTAAGETEAAKTDLEVAQTILGQLGGGRFIAMTGARLFAGSADALSFRLPSNFAKDGINAVRIVLNVNDLYDVTFYRIRGTKVVTIAQDGGIFADMLIATFTERTGLSVTL